MFEPTSKDFDVSTLFAETLAGAYEDDGPHRAIGELCCLGTPEVLERAIAWSVAEDPRRREIAAAVLGQLSNSAKDGNQLHREERFETLRRMVLNEPHELPLAAALCGLGHLGDARALPLVLPMATHESAEVRFAVAFALGCYADDDTAVPGLITLMTDADADVRDWATFGLGTQGSADSPEIRAAFTERLSDANENVAAEAMAGLAKRGQNVS